MPKAAATSNRPLLTQAQAASHPVPDLHNQLEPRTRDITSRVRRARATPVRATNIRRLCGRGINRLRNRPERGAVTAEYAIMIVGACAIGGVLVALLRSPAMQNALKAIINYGLKIAGVEGVHL
ncbi:uncharacterized protein DUF4244 [Kribbella sp. VKM Ac-2571]|uniref:DUF4244 domain-containing protein n=1 Tax=Kribbella sp. VKM Ac-2571 TaxID=2512222 RepID=UPI00105B3B53|nr:DUF4244 domain-containing protein [Kribbella sp. VKM Ac-2571]TDO59688.1 uncharacterized protein DUF4244 [Kribbella sp. VKM Ac-2571]